VIAPGDGLAALFTSAGASVVRATNGEPTISELRAAVRACGAGEVVLLPSGRAAGALAEHIVHTSPADGPRVRVVPTRAAVQSLAALAVHDPARGFDDDVIAMTAAAVTTRYGSLTHAVREALTSAGRCSPGDVLGMVGEDVVTFGRDIDPIAGEVIDRLLAAGGEMVTLVTGAGATPGFVAALTARLRRSHPGVEVIAYDGGQPDHPLLVGVE
jgi:dihydroxyacetone kinase-like predicted kinase